MKSGHFRRNFGQGFVEIAWPGAAPTPFVVPRGSMGLSLVIYERQESQTAIMVRFNSILIQF